MTRLSTAKCQKILDLYQPVNGEPLSLSDIACHVHCDRSTVHARTVLRRLAEIGLPVWVRRWKPLLKKSSLAQRRVWVKDVEGWGNIIPRVTGGGGKVTIWGCITSRGVGCLHRIEGTMDAKMYHHILEESLLGTLCDHWLGPNTIIFQHDNDPKHTAHLVQEWLEHQNLLVLPWPPSSPDLNIIENVWAEIKKHLETYRPRPRNTEELWRVVQKLWYGLDKSFIQGLYHSLPRQVKTVKAGKGLSKDS
ncbi:hypothetical protein NUW54_g4364 [Trametes sanguinea]|uniref:Uncharacterized protein n=1 Tax=Trametes sanguinea TaxID=158606 RepID=A0ACC1PY48_9APHY|nr:hypothetical protein NUW54_g4364 [Trametes sanguinea]